MKASQKRLLLLPIILFIVLLDIITKNIAVTVLKDGGAKSIDILKGMFAFTYVENRGAAWGILANHRWIFIILSAVSIIVILIYLFISKQQSKLVLTSLSFIVGGGIGNMIDRLTLGYVVDFLNFYLIDFPVFNVADCFVTIGAALLIIYLFIPTQKDTQGN